MCNITSKVKDRKTILHGATGYKVALKKNGKYYSPSNGIEYKVGDVPPAGEANQLIYCGYGNPCKEREKHPFFSEYYNNLKLTAVILEKSHAKDLLSPTRHTIEHQTELGNNPEYITAVLLKMKVRTNLHHGEFEQFGQIIAGSKILSIEEEIG